MLPRVLTSVRRRVLTHRRPLAAVLAAVAVTAGVHAATDPPAPTERVLTAARDLPAGTVSAAVALAGTTDPVIGPADVEVAEGALTIAYAWGSAEDGNLQLAVQTVDGLHSGPDGVNTGSAGFVAENGVNAWLVVGGAGLLAAVIAGGVLVTRSAAARR